MKKAIPLVVGNWKMNPATLEEAVRLAAGVARRHKQSTASTVVIAPPFPYITEVGKKIKKSSVVLAAQDVSGEVAGPFTGEVSAAQLKDVGAQYVIVGHSERRALGETDTVVRQKMLSAIKQQLIPIVCIGEQARDERGDFYSVIESQLQTLFDGVPAPLLKKMVIAYEPIWAIGSGMTATADIVREMQIFIESVLTKIYDRAVAGSVQLLYGGSVGPHNVTVLHEHGGMDGFLVGGFSLKVDDFGSIIESIQKI